MNITYDRVADAAYIYLRKFKKSARTVPITNELIIDYGKRGQILGIEILNASSHMNLKDTRGINLQILGPMAKHPASLVSHLTE